MYPTFIYVSLEHLSSFNHQHILHNFLLFKKFNSPLTATAPAGLQVRRRGPAGVTGHDSSTPPTLKHSATLLSSGDGSRPPWSLWRSWWTAFRRPTTPPWSWSAWLPSTTVASSSRTSSPCTPPQAAETTSTSPTSDTTPTPHHGNSRPGSDRSRSTSSSSYALPGSWDSSSEHRPTAKTGCRSLTLSIARCTQHFFKIPKLPLHFFRICDGCVKVVRKLCGSSWSVKALQINLLYKSFTEKYGSTWSIKVLRINLIRKRLTD